MGICVKSEIGKLKRVMLHRPGKELEKLIPGELERLLFDDIPYLKTARQEHDQFAGLLRDNDVEVVYLEDLMVETLKQEEGLREAFIEEYIQDGGDTAHQYREHLKEYLMSIRDERELVEKTMEGVYMEEIRSRQATPLVDLVRDNLRFVTNPIPNLYFTRDPFASIGYGVSINKMYSETRRRETIYGKYIINYHPDFAGRVKQYYHRDDLFSIEGGDILVLGRRVLAVGISQRTTPEAVELLAKRIFADEASDVETILALDIPNLRAYMHLDTVLTQVDYDKFTVYPGILGRLRIYEICRGEKTDTLRVSELDNGLAMALATHLGLDEITLIHCGGRNGIASEREQWNDGSNTLAIAPGRVIVYDRNNITNQILRENGIQVLAIPSSELSRGRGGPRCMSMPLIREDV